MNEAGHEGAYEILLEPNKRFDSRSFKQQVAPGYVPYRAGSRGELGGVLDSAAESSVWGCSCCRSCCYEAWEGGVGFSGSVWVIDLGRLESDWGMGGRGSRGVVNEGFVHTPALFGLFVHFFRGASFWLANV